MGEGVVCHPTIALIRDGRRGRRLWFVLCSLAGRQGMECRGRSSALHGAVFFSLSTTAVSDMLLCACDGQGVLLEKRREETEVEMLMSAS